MREITYYRKIAEYRNKNNLTQEELSALSAVSLSNIKAIETGRVAGAKNDLSSIAKVLNVDLGEIYNSNFRDTKVVSIVNNKGGVGKTSICGSLAFALSEMNYKILLIDADMQSNLTHSYGLECTDKNLGEAFKNSDILLKNEEGLTNYIEKTQYENIDFIVSNSSMASIEMELNMKFQRENLMKYLIDPIIKNGEYDLIIIDTNPVLGMLNYSIINSSNYVIIPTELSAFALDGLDTLLSYIETIRISNSSLQIAGIVINKYDLREKNVTDTCMDIIKQVFGDKTFQTKIGIDTKLKKAQLRNSPVLCTDTNSRISKQFRSLAKEVSKVIL